MEERFSHWTERLIYTAGVKHLADTHGAHWLVDLIASFQSRAYPRVIAEPFQVWVLRVYPDRSAVVRMGDGNLNHAIVEQPIEYTDFPGEGEVELLCIQEGEFFVLMTLEDY